LTGARVIAFATHGLMPSDTVSRGRRSITAAEILRISEPGLVLTPPGEASAEDDGYLAASEVATLRLNSDWVILSACNSASGDAATAGISQLARAFFFAGARNLLASHWPVADDVAAQLTVKAIEIEGGLNGETARSRPEALQEAMRRVRSDRRYDRAGQTRAHPFFWAPFVLIGDGGR
jgi:CHAT domain-containing protein